MVLNNNSCESRFNAHIDREMFFYVKEFTYTHRSSLDTWGCVKFGRAFETVWDGDIKNPYYKDLRSSNRRFRRCENLGTGYRRVSFRYIANSRNWDHVVVAFGENGRVAVDAWNN